MIIDGHAHAAGVFFKKDTLVETLDNLGVDKVVLAPMGVSGKEIFGKQHFDDLFDCNKNPEWLDIKKVDVGLPDVIYEKPNLYLYDLAQQCPDRIIQFYWANPNNPNIIAELEHRFTLWNFKGVKLHQMIEDFDTDSPTMNDIAAFCCEKNIPCFIHLFKRRHIFQLIELMTNHQHTRFIIGHMIGYEIIKDNALGLDNFWFDISPRIAVPDKKILDAVNNFGSERILLGSDTPLSGNRGLEKNINRVRSLNLSDSDTNKILGNNLQALLGL